VPCLRARLHEAAAWGRTARRRASLRHRRGAAAKEPWKAGEGTSGKKWRRASLRRRRGAAARVSKTGLVSAAPAPVLAKEPPALDLTSEHEVREAWASCRGGARHVKVKGVQGVARLGFRVF